MTQTLLSRLDVFGSSLLLGFQYLPMVRMFRLLAGFRSHLVAQRNQFAQTCSIGPVIFLWSFEVDSDHALTRRHPLLPCHSHGAFLALPITIHVQEFPSWKRKFQFNPQYIYSSNFALVFHGQSSYFELFRSVHVLVPPNKQEHQDAQPPHQLFCFRYQNPGVPQDALTLSSELQTCLLDRHIYFSFSFYLSLVYFGIILSLFVGLLLFLLLLNGLLNFLL